MPVGLYDLLHTEELQERLKKACLLDRSEWAQLDLEQLKHRLAIPLAREIASFISETVFGKKEEAFERIQNALFDSPEKLLAIIKSIKPTKPESLMQIKPPEPFVASEIRPDTPLCISALLTGSSRSPSLRSQLIKELATCDRADWLVSFIKYAGLVPLLPTLREFVQSPAKDGGPRLRVATTSYMGATDLKAIKELLKLPNCEVKMSFDTRRTRLHAKAYLFYRDSGFGSAYIGSANVSKAALDEGLEWTAKISQYETDYLWQHAVASFESHWEDSSEFTLCKEIDLPTIADALKNEKGTGVDTETPTFFDLRPYGFQQAILDDIAAERQFGKSRHLIIAATGTGKTMIAAFDYKTFASKNKNNARLLFVAHREEILKQARSAFRQILRDGSFGEIIAGGVRPKQINHLFCTVQSWNSQSFDNFDPGHFDYIVLDEAHHASAESYQRLITHIKPKSLIGLTATPERSDGQDIRKDFGGRFTHEIRLPEAIERSLLSPFHYYGIPDLEKIDFSQISWKRGGYDVKQLQELLEENFERASWVINQTERYVADITDIRAIGFCVSVLHAEFMADFCNKNNISAVCLTGDSPQEIRQTVQRKLECREINFIFTVDLYNEGVDIPCVDTVLFLRPTESLTLFLQQLGRGLRLHNEKSHLTVLDFIARQGHKFNFAKRFKALTSRPELRIISQIESDMPFVPSGCLIHLEKQAKEHVLENIRASISGMKGKTFLNELKLLKQNLGRNIKLQDILDNFNLDSPDLIYQKALPHKLLAMADADEKIIPTDSDSFIDKLSQGFRRLALMDDTNLLSNMQGIILNRLPNSTLTQTMVYSLLWGSKKPGNGSLEEAHDFFVTRPGLLNDLKELIEWLLQNKPPLPELQLQSLTGPLNLHGSYTREQILMASGSATFDRVPRTEGVFHVPEKKIDIFFADINKSETDFSPTTMYEDYAISDRLFHWQSQSQTTETSSVGKRYIRHKEMGYTPILFIRDRKKLSSGLTSPYFFAGPLKYRKHEGSKPVSFIWELEYPLPAKVMPWATRKS